MNRRPVVSLAACDAVLGDRSVDCYDAAREQYVAYGELLCRSGVFSPLAITRAILIGFARPAVLLPTADMAQGAKIGIYDALGANGLRSLNDVGIDCCIDIRLTHVLSCLSFRKRMPIVGLLVVALGRSSRSFFGRLFELYREVASEMLQRIESDVIYAANERSIGTMPFFAAAKFLYGRSIAVIQHGNPVRDYLPTMADIYLCRSERWANYLRSHRLVAEVRRIGDFPKMTYIRHDSSSRRVVLVLHNLGYLEPEIDYVTLTRQIRIICSDSGHELFVLPHPSNSQTFGLPVFERNESTGVALVIGYRTTFLDQIQPSIPKVSLLDYWPSFFLHEGTKAQIDHFILSMERALK